MAALVAAAMFTSCSQEGPAGPTGPTGYDGLTGPTGANGTPNITVGTGTLAAASWAASSSPNVYIQTFSDGAITDFTSDVVMVYVQGTASSSSDFYALPITGFLNGGDAISYSYNNGLITFYYTYTSSPAVDMVVKVAVIPPSVMKQHPGLNVNDYKAVMALVHPTAATK